MYQLDQETINKTNKFKDIVNALLKKFSVFTKEDGREAEELYKKDIEVAIAVYADEAMRKYDRYKDVETIRPDQKIDIAFGFLNANSASALLFLYKKFLIADEADEKVIFTVEKHWERMNLLADFFLALSDGLGDQLMGELD